MADKAADLAKKANLSPATLLDAVADLEDHKEKLTTATGKYRLRRKHWKSLGVNLKVLDEMLALKREDSADLKDHEIDRARYAAWLNIDLGVQAELPLEETSVEHKEKLAKYDAEKDGYNFGRRGDAKSLNPFEPGTVAHVAWLHGWDRGDTDNFNDAKPVERKGKKGKGAEMGKKKDAAATPAAADPAATPAVQPDAPVAEQPVAEPPAPLAAAPTSDMPDIPESLRRTATDETVQ